MHGPYTGTLNGVAPIQTGSGGEESHPINSLKNEQGRGHTVAVEKRVHLLLIGQSIKTFKR